MGKRKHEIPDQLMRYRRRPGGNEAHDRDRLDAALGGGEGGVMDGVVERVWERLEFRRHVQVTILVSLLLLIINLLTSTDYLWFVWPWLGMWLGVGGHWWRLRQIRQRRALEGLAGGGMAED